MRKFLLLLLLGLFLTTAPSALDADARYLRLAVTYDLQPDGTVLLDYQHQVRLDTYSAINRLGETFVVYNPRFQELKVLKAETTMAGGRKVPSPPNAFNEVLPADAHLFPVYSHLREMVITHTGLERGCTVELHYQLKTRPGWMPCFTIRELAGRNYPVDLYTLRVTAPAASPLKGQVFNLARQPAVTRQQGRQIWTLEARDLAPLVFETSSRISDYPAAVVGTASSWPQALPQAPADGLPAALAERARRLQQENPDPLTLMLAVRQLVADEYALCGLPPSLTGLASRPLAEIHQTNYGTRPEKAFLLAAMLNTVQVPAEVLAVLDLPDPASEVPAVQQAESYLVKAGTAGEQAYLDPAGSRAGLFPYPKAGCKAFNLTKKTFEMLPAVSSSQSGLEVTGEVKLAADGGTGTLTVRVDGNFLDYSAAVENSGRFLSGLLGRVLPAAEYTLKKVTLLSPASLRAEMEMKGKWLQEPAGKVLALPFIRLPQPGEDVAAAGPRIWPYHLDAPACLSVRLRLEPPAGWTADYLAPPVAVDNPVGSVQRELKPAGDGKLELICHCRFRQADIAAARFSDLQALLRTFFAPGWQMVLLPAK